MTTTFERLGALLVKDYKVRPEDLSSDATLASLGIDSLDAVELLWNTEAVFQIKLPPEPVELATLGDVVRYIDELVAKQGAAAMAGPLGMPAVRSP